MRSLIVSLLLVFTLIVAGYSRTVVVLNPSEDGKYAIFNVFSSERFGKAPMIELQFDSTDITTFDPKIAAERMISLVEESQSNGESLVHLYLLNIDLKDKSFNMEVFSSKLEKAGMMYHVLNKKWKFLSVIRTISSDKSGTETVVLDLTSSETQVYTERIIKFEENLTLNLLKIKKLDDKPKKLVVVSNRIAGFLREIGATEDPASIQTISNYVLSSVLFVEVQENTRQALAEVVLVYDYLAVVEIEVISYDDLLLRLVRGLQII